jgi:hypothetical protein
MYVLVEKENFKAKIKEKLKFFNVKFYFWPSIVAHSNCYHILQGLIVDQTIEKVSFCAPDRNHEKGFSYICRDGTTRRWMCHGFLAIKETVSVSYTFSPSGTKCVCDNKPFVSYSEQTF